MAGPPPLSARSVLPWTPLLCQAGAHAWGSPGAVGAKVGSRLSDDFPCSGDAVRQGKRELCSA